MDEGKAQSEAWVNATTFAAGLRVPKAYGDYIILDILRKSRGTRSPSLTKKIMQAVRAWAREEGLFAAPEGAASLAAYRKLAQDRFPESKRHRGVVQYRLRAQIH